MVTYVAGLRWVGIWRSRTNDEDPSYYFLHKLHHRMRYVVHIRENEIHENLFRLVWKNHLTDLNI